MKKTLTGISYTGLALSNAALAYFGGIGKDGYLAMGQYEWLTFSLTMAVNVFIVTRALANGTFSNGNNQPKATS